MNNRLNRGFTLIEVAMVILIAGLMMTGILGAINTLRKSTGLNETSERLNTIEIALRTFILRNNRLPCPANKKLDVENQDWGVEYDTGVAGDCDDALGTDGTYLGVLPLRSLEFNDEFLDSWDHHYTYHILEEATQPNAVTNTLWPNDVFDVLTNAVGTTTRFPNDKPILIIVSHGPNGSGAWMRTTEDETTGSPVAAPPITALNELENLDGDVIYVNADYSADDETPFDDLVIALTESRLLRPLEEQGVLKTKDHLTRYKMELIVNSIYGFSTGDTIDPDGAREPFIDAVSIGVPGPGGGPGGPGGLVTIKFFDGSCRCVGEEAPAGYSVDFCTNGCRSIRHRIPYADSSDPVNGTEDSADLDSDLPYDDLGLDASDVIDGWGNRIQYLIYFADAACCVPDTVSNVAGVFSESKTPIFRIQSDGPDGTDNSCGGDDICITVNRNEMLGKFTSAGIKVD